MQSKGSRSNFNFKKFPTKGIYLKAVFFGKISDIGLLLNKADHKMWLSALWSEKVLIAFWGNKKKKKLRHKT